MRYAKKIMNLPAMRGDLPYQEGHKDARHAAAEIAAEAEAEIELVRRNRSDCRRLASALESSLRAQNSMVEALQWERDRLRESLEELIGDSVLGSKDGQFLSEHFGENGRELVIKAISLLAMLDLEDEETSP